MNLQLLPVTKVAQSAVVTHDVDGALTKDYVARTDVSALSNAPKFNNRCFVLRVPEVRGPTLAIAPNERKPAQRGGTGV